MSFFFKHHRGYTFVSLWHFFACVSGPLPGFSSRANTRKREQKAEGGPHLKNTVLDVCSNQRAKSEMAQISSEGPGTTGPPMATTLMCLPFAVVKICCLPFMKHGHCW